MKQKVYVETTIVSYLTARPSRDVVMAGRQQTTRDWWESARKRFDFVASELVIDEAADGDPDAARERLASLSSLSLLEATAEAERFAEFLLRSGVVPKRAATDAAHIAIAVINGVEYLVTWNCRHIANAAIRAQIERSCRDAGYEPTIICTPDELMETDDEYAAQ